MAFFDIGIIGYWNALTNDRGLRSGRGTKGDTYQVSVAGTTTLDNVTTWAVDDLAVFAGDRWIKLLGNSATPSALGLQTQIDAAAINGQPLVNGNGRTYTLTAPILMRPGVDVENVNLIQGNGANLVTLVDFVANGASNSVLRQSTVDGNNANNTTNYNLSLVAFGNLDGCEVTNCTLKNSVGHGILGLACTNFRINNNEFSDNIALAVAIAGSGVVGNGWICFNNFTNTRRHPIYIDGSSSNVVRGNKIRGPFVTGMVVNVNGTAVTWVSGPQFNDIRKGNFIVYNGGTESLIASVNSAISITLEFAGPVVAGVAAVAAPGDLITIMNSSDNLILDNEGYGSVTSLVSIFAQASATNRTIIRGNRSYGSGGCGICLTGAAGGINGTVVENNDTINPGLGLAATAAGFLAGVVVLINSFKTFIGGNTTYDNQGAPSAQNGVVISGGVAPGEVIVTAPNATIGVINEGISGAINTVTLSAGWGTTAAVTNIFSDGDTVSFSVTPGGAGIAANGTIDVSHRVVPKGLPHPIIRHVWGSAFPAPAVVGTFAAARTNSVFFMVDVPVAGQRYDFVVNF